LFAVVRLLELRAFTGEMILSHLHSLMVTMSQKSSVPKAAISVSQALMSDSAMRERFSAGNKVARGVIDQHVERPAIEGGVH
jgi:hypothetical protein